jgi:DNA adenine methylase
MNHNSQIISPLRYPGSKRRLVGYIKDCLLLNNKKPSLFIEPFAGSASVALQLLQDEYVSNAILIDLDPWITSFWHTVFFDTEWLIGQIATIEVSIITWNYFKHFDPQTTRDQAITCFFLNRTNFSGILEKKVGPIGVKKQQSSYKINCRFPKDKLIYRIKQASRLKDRIYRIWNCSWIDGINRIRNAQESGEILNSNLFFYLDPPFYNHAEALYRYYFVEKDHKELRDFLLTLNDDWLLSYDSDIHIKTLYQNAGDSRYKKPQKDIVQRIYSIASSPKRKASEEIIISNLKKLVGQRV